MVICIRSFSTFKIVRAKFLNSGFLFLTLQRVQNFSQHMNRLIIKKIFYDFLIEYYALFLTIKNFVYLNLNKKQSYFYIFFFFSNQKQRLNKHHQHERAHE